MPDGIYRTVENSPSSVSSVTGALLDCPSPMAALLPVPESCSAPLAQLSIERLSFLRPLIAWSMVVAPHTHTHTHSPKVLDHSALLVFTAVSIKAVRQTTLVCRE